MKLIIARVVSDPDTPRRQLHYRSRCFSLVETPPFQRPPPDTTALTSSPRSNRPKLCSRRELTTEGLANDRHSCLHNSMSETMAEHVVPTVTKSTLAQKLDEGGRTPTSPPSLSTGASPKPRSLSDASKPTLSPSPAFREPARRVSKDDTFSSPTTPKRPLFPNRGLSLQIQKDGGGSPATLSTSRVPLSPKLDASQIYGSPASMLPRRSRGLDYTRACTNLHHSTLAESSPDASPTMGGRGMQIPQRRSLGSTVLDSPSNISSSLWSTVPNADRTALSSSVSSINMLDSGSDSETTSDEDMDRDTDDPMLNTPAASKINGPILSGMLNSPGGEWMNTQTSPAFNSLMSFRRARLGKKGKSRHSSSSVSINSSKPSPGPLSPPLMKSIETANGGYFNSGLTRQQVQSRRESLSLGTDDLHLSDSEDGESRITTTHINSAIMDSPGMEGPRGVIRRTVTRRGNLLPKTKHFARVKAALLEESAPVDSEARREAQVIRQVQDNDSTANLTTTASTVLQPPTPYTEEPLESSPEYGEDNPQDAKALLSTEPFSRHAQRNSAGLGFWHAFDDRYRTPPPQLHPRDLSSGMSDENMSLETVASSLENPSLASLQRSRSRSTTPLAAYPQPTAGDVARKVNNKRRRDDDFDPASFKRRAVSPGMSVASSPVLPQSPIMSSEKSWGLPPPIVAPKANGHENVRSNSGGSTVSNGNGMKRVGMQGMMETNDAIMAMSID